MTLSSSPSYTFLDPTPSLLLTSLASDSTPFFNNAAPLPPQHTHDPTTNHKFHADGTWSCYKARLVANGSSQQLGVYFDKTFSPFVKLDTIRTSLALSSSSLVLLQQIIDFLHNEFDMTNLGALNYFLGIFATRTPTSLFLSQNKYALQLLECAHMVNCNPSRTPVDMCSCSGSYIITFLQGITCEIVPFNVGSEQNTYQAGLYVSATTSLVGYRDADWAGCPSTCRSTSGYYVFLGDNLLSWSSKRQPTLLRSSAEGEYRGVANVAAESAWLRNLLRELQSLLSTATFVYCDNVSAVYIFVNPVQHQQTKHIEIDIHFVCDMVTVGQVRVLHVPSRYQYVDIFIKGLPSALFEDFRSSLSVRPHPV
ncbi:ribonuclease H-like domain-containing protein [Tanacetum coccineum]